MVVSKMEITTQNSAVSILEIVVLKLLRNPRQLHILCRLRFEYVTNVQYIKHILHKAVQYIKYFFFYWLIYHINVQYAKQISI